MKLGVILTSTTTKYCRSCGLNAAVVERAEQTVSGSAEVVRHSKCGHILMYRGGVGIPARVSHCPKCGYQLSGRTSIPNDRDAKANHVHAA